MYEGMLLLDHPLLVLLTSFAHLLHSRSQAFAFLDYASARKRRALGSRLPVAPPRLWATNSVELQLSIVPCPGLASPSALSPLSPRCAQSKKKEGFRQF